jgi:hypothetical protein
MSRPRRSQLSFATFPHTIGMSLSKSLRLGTAPLRLCGPLRSLREIDFLIPA